MRSIALGYFGAQSTTCASLTCAQSPLAVGASVCPLARLNGAPCASLWANVPTGHPTICSPTSTSSYSHGIRPPEPATPFSGPNSSSLWTLLERRLPFLQLWYLEDANDGFVLLILLLFILCNDVNCFFYSGGVKQNVWPPNRIPSTNLRSSPAALAPFIRSKLDSKPAPEVEDKHWQLFAGEKYIASDAGEISRHRRTLHSCNVPRIICYCQWLRVFAKKKINSLIASLNQSAAVFAS